MYEYVYVYEKEQNKISNANLSIKAVIIEKTESEEMKGEAPVLNVCTRWNILIKNKKRMT